MILQKNKIKKKTGQDKTRQDKVRQDETGLLYRDKNKTMYSRTKQDTEEQTALLL